MLEITFQKVGFSDLPKLILVTRSAYEIPYKKGGPVTKPHESDEIDDQFMLGKFFAIFATAGDEIAGAIRYKITPENDLYFYQLAVLKNYRNQGIGEKLMIEIEKVARKNKCQKILLDCAQEKKLPEYYQKFGFKIDKIEKHLDHHDVYMSKEI